MEAAGFFEMLLTTVKSILVLLTGRPQGCENVRFKGTHVVLLSNNDHYYMV